jgi:hypothetical protein
MLIAIVEQGCKAEAVLNAVNRTIDSITNTAVFFSLQTGFLRRNV